MSQLYDTNILHRLVLVLYLHYYAFFNALL